MTSRRPRRLARRLFTGQILVILVGVATLGAVAFVVAPPIFRDHVQRAVGPVSDVVGHHLDAALSETLMIALTIGLVGATASAAAVSWLLARRIARPVERLSETAGQLAAGQLHARTPRPGADDELADLADAFNDMAEAIERTEETRRGLLADLAHELRTPLATIEAYHEGLVDGVVEPTGETWATLQEATGRLQRLVEDLGLVSRAEEGRLSFEKGPVEVGELVTTAVDALAPAAREHHVAVLTDLPSSPITLQGDRDRLAQVLTNLLANALEHTPAGGEVSVSASRSEDGVDIEVADSGEGIAAEHLPHLFQRFYRADPSRHRVGGSGIGLTISRAIVHGHGGDITASSDGPGQGARFHIHLPSAPPLPKG
ncbi:MAG: ATP-binding protein [Nitriliruptoraceae bacterium]